MKEELIPFSCPLQEEQKEEAICAKCLRMFPFTSWLLKLDFFKNIAEQTWRKWKVQKLSIYYAHS